MASGLPNDFLSWKSFQSLTQTAALAWMITLIIDVIFIQGIEQPRTQLTWIWIVGFAICFILACIRLYFKEEKEKGDKFMLLFNAALIFLYASGFNGFTKELGSWSEINKMNAGTSAVSSQMRQELKTTLASFVPNIFANQTAIWPDVKMMNENQFYKVENENLKKENQQIKDAFGGRIPVDSSSFLDRLQELESENERLYALLIDCQGYDCAEYIKIIEEKNEEVNQLRDSLNNVSSADCSKQEQMINRLQKQIEKLRAGEASSDCEETRKANESLLNENNRLTRQLDILVSRINGRNGMIAEYKQIINGSRGIKIQQDQFYEIITKEFNSSGGPRYVELVRDLLNNETDARLP